MEAFSAASGGSGPDWSHARLYTGQATADDIVSPELRSWAAERGKEEVELAQARAKIRDSKRLGSHATEGNETGDHSEVDVDVGGAVQPKGWRPRRRHEPSRQRCSPGWCLGFFFKSLFRTFSSAFDPGRKVLMQIEQAIVTETGAPPAQDRIRKRRAPDPQLDGWLSVSGYLHSLGASIRDRREGGEAFIRSI